MANSSSNIPKNISVSVEANGDVTLKQNLSVLHTFKNPATATIDVKTTSYTTISSDVGKIISIDSSSSVNLTLSGLTNGQTIKVHQAGLGQITFVAGALSPKNVRNWYKSAGKYSFIDVTIIGTDAILTGDLTA